MVISRTPFRISFFGGGTDYPVWYKENGGSVLSTTINKYCYITTRFLPPFFDYKHRIRYFKREDVKTIDQIKHPSVRECMKYLKIKEGIEIVHHADLPARSGLGSSSSFTVGLLNALWGLKNSMPSKEELMYQAIHIEQDLINENVGSQDQAAAAFGGFNRFDFLKNGNIQSRPILIDQEGLSCLQNNLLLFFTGISRTASKIAGQKIQAIPKRHEQLLRMMNLVDDAFTLLKEGKDNMDEFGRLLDEQWNIKKTITKNISNDKIDSIYETALKSGALGGKLLGAGNGGFIVFYVQPKYQRSVIQKLSPLLHVPFKFEFEGSKIIYYSNNNHE